MSQTGSNTTARSGKNASDASTTTCVSFRQARGRRMVEPFSDATPSKTETRTSRPRSPPPCTNISHPPAWAPAHPVLESATRSTRRLPEGTSNKEKHRGGPESLQVGRNLAVGPRNRPDTRIRRATRPGLHGDDQPRTRHAVVGPARLEHEGRHD